MKNDDDQNLRPRSQIQRIASGDNRMKQYFKRSQPQGQKPPDSDEAIRLTTIPSTAGDKHGRR
ncbi:MAG: hypothetical protein WBX15_12690 [Thermoanaerobaculia bacterium]